MEYTVAGWVSEVVEDFDNIRTVYHVEILEEGEEETIDEIMAVIIRGFFEDGDKVMAAIGILDFDEVVASFWQLSGVLVLRSL
ncbi:hypothetical protein AGMMS49921_11720 [Endomicrobiia bacterium]|nr:hypothetical protein AGMMS49921_11720 [Endomicrobiia bacterium]